MAISPEQRQFRAGRIGSSDARRIMDGQWHELWLEKTGRAEPPDLDFVPAVQIGIATEALHARFYTRRTGIGCYPADAETFVHPDHSMLVAHLDYLTWSEASGPFLGPPDTVMEAKFCSTPLDDEELAERYFWQLQHQMMVSGYTQAVLSILRPSGYSTVTVPFDRERARLLLETELAFWWHVESDTPPGDPLPIEPPPPDRARVLDMSLHNAFAAHTETLVSNRAGAQAYREAETALKALMPEGAQIAHVSSEGDGRGLYLQRSRDGRLTLRFGNLPGKYATRSEIWMPEGIPEAAE